MVLVTGVWYEFMVPSLRWSIMVDFARCSNWFLVISVWYGFVVPWGSARFGGSRFGGTGTWA